MTAFGALPTDQPMPVGSVQRKLGAQEGWFPWPVANDLFLAGLGGANQMVLDVRPKYRCWWVVQANWIVQSSGNWGRCDAGLQCNPPDRNGIGWGAQVAHSMATGVPWMSLSMQGLWLLEANQSYSCFFTSLGTDTVTQYFRAARHLNMFGYTIGEGTIA